MKIPLLILAAVAVIGYFVFFGRATGPSGERSLRQAFGSSDKMSVDACHPATDAGGRAVSVCKFAWEAPIESLQDAGALEEGAAEERACAEHVSKDARWFSSRRVAGNGPTLRVVAAYATKSGMTAGCAVVVTPAG